MKRIGLVAGLLATCLAAAGPARADYAVVQFNNGFCKIWWDSADNPWGANWTKIAMGLPDHAAALAALDGAVAQGACH